MDFQGLIADQLDAARRRSLDLLAPLPDRDLTRQISPIMSPLVWDLAHVGNYEELWLLRAVTGTPPIDASLDPMYDAFRHPRKDRPALPLLGPTDARRYIGDVRGRVLDSLDLVSLDDRLTAGGFVYGMVIQHEHQHDETMLATLQLLDGAGYRPIAAPPPQPPQPPHGPGLPAEVLVPAGTFVMGADDDPWAYDNERPAHEIDLPAFWIDTTPVTNGAYIGFIDDGGYSRPELWCDEGWQWRMEEPAEAPQYWRRDGDTWARARFGWREEVPADEPVQHVCWYEADAFARWAGRRLPTEPEWEKAASWDEAAGVKRRYPWGDSPDEAAERCNIGQTYFRPAPVGAYPSGASPYGCHQMVGDVWEWTSTEFQPYPGFASYPYREYSEVFYDSGYKVLRGGAWATDKSVARATFRNWDFPIRRQIFAGFRTVRDAQEADGASPRS